MGPPPLAQYQNATTAAPVGAIDWRYTLTRAAAAGALFWVSPYLLVYGFILFILPALLGPLALLVGLYLAGQAVRPGSPWWGLVAGLILLFVPGLGGEGLIDNGLDAMASSMFFTCLVCGGLRYLLFSRDQKNAVPPAS